jgi:uncharacterized RDD family membrane protein YckC
MWERALAWTIDALVVTLPYIILHGILGLAGALLGSAASIAYFATLEGGPRGQTLGKRLVRIQVQRASGENPIGFPRALVRVLAKGVLVPGYLWPLWDPMGQALHDKAADTIVIRLPTPAQANRNDTQTQASHDPGLE